MRLMLVNGVRPETSVDLFEDLAQRLRAHSLDVEVVHGGVPDPARVTGHDLLVSNIPVPRRIREALPCYGDLPLSRPQGLVFLEEASVDFMRRPGGELVAIEINSQFVATWWTSQYEFMRERYTRALLELVQRHASPGASRSPELEAAHQAQPSRTGSRVSDQVRTSSLGTAASATTRKPCLS